MRRVALLCAAGDRTLKSNMATASHKLTYEEFAEKYSDLEATYEFWYGEAVRKGMPTWVHGLLQQIIMGLLHEAGFVAASEVELRIEADAHPKPDVIATKTKPSGRYPTAGLDVVIEILSEDDKYALVQRNCRKYQEWGFRNIYLVEPTDRSVVEWRDGAQIPVTTMAGVPVEEIWKRLDLQYEA